MYKAILTLGQKLKYEAESATLEDAIGKLNYPPSALSGKIVFQEGARKFERIMYPRLLRKLSVNKVYREIVAKSARVMLDSQKKPKKIKPNE